VEIIRLELSKIPGFMRRGLTEFTYSRFLVPYLSGFEGVSLFLDSDILVREDIYELESLYGHGSDVWMVHHENRKFENPSVMLFDNENCRELTRDFISTARMYDFSWVKNAGKLAPEWNHLVGYDAPNPDAKIVHFTMGIPVWKETIHCEFAQEWIDTFKRMNSTVSFEELMGKSVHMPNIKNLKLSETATV
jgi:hypothetical protein